MRRRSQTVTVLRSSHPWRVADVRVWEPVDLADEGAVRERLSQVRVLVVGCGGLGSNVAHMLVRSGVGALTIVDFDVVEPSNLNRQQYYGDQLGRLKVEVTREHLLRIDPGCSIETISERVDAARILDLAGGHDVLIEAVDDADLKLRLMHATAGRELDVPMVFGSGLAGVGPGNHIRTELLGEGFYVCGDLASDVRAHPVLMAPRVVLAAAHQALAAVRIVLGHPEVE